MQDLVDGLEAVAHQRRDLFLRHVALGAEVAPRRHRRQRLAVAVHVVGDADGRGLAARAIGPAVAGQALVTVLVDLVAANAVRDGRRLFGVVSLALDILVFIFGQRRGRPLLGDGAPGAATVRRRRIQRVIDLGSDGGANHDEQQQRQDSKGHDGSPQAALINSMRMAHFL
ncbi:hypothetical protein D3C73_1127030 [compost metagenome]